MGDYCQPDCSVLKSPVTRGGAGSSKCIFLLRGCSTREYADLEQVTSLLTDDSDLKSKIETDLKKLVRQISKRQSVSTEVMHQLNPIWLEKRYQSYSETSQLFYSTHLMAYEWEAKCFVQLKLPPQQIKGYFNQASAVVLQKDDLLVLLDECLSVITIQENVNP